jgi:hypothetical protein
MRDAQFLARRSFAEAGAALCVVPAEVADVDAAKFIDLRLLFLMLFLLRLGGPWRQDRTEAERAKKAAPRLER